MKTFVVELRIDLIKTFTIQAETLNEARQIAEQGEYNEEDLINEECINFEVLTVEE